MPSLTAEQYYYSEGKQIRLVPDPEYVAINLGCVNDPKRLAGLDGFVVGDVELVHSAQASKKLLISLQDSGALIPVYKVGGVHIAVLPEVRVELNKNINDQVLQSAIEASGINVSIEPTGTDTFVLRPNSGSGTEALSLANFIHERIQPPLAQARFLRITPRLKTVTR